MRGGRYGRLVRPRQTAGRTLDLEGREEQGGGRGVRGGESGRGRRGGGWGGEGRGEGRGADPSLPRARAGGGETLTGE